MTFFLLSIIMGLLWAFVTGAFTPANLLLGLGVSVLVLLFLRRMEGFPPGVRRLVDAGSLAFFFLKELARASLRVSREVLTPSLMVRPAIIAVPLSARGDAEIWLLSTLLTLTPGSVALDVSADRRVMFIHAMYVEDPDAYRKEVKEGFERRVMAVMS